MKRERKLTVLLSDDETTQLKRLADDAGLSISDYIRQFVRAAHAVLETKSEKKP